MEQSILDVHCDCKFAIRHTVHTKAHGVVIDAIFHALAPPTRRDLAKPERDSFSRGSVLTIASPKDSLVIPGLTCLRLPRIPGSVIHSLLFPACQTLLILIRILCLQEPRIYYYEWNIVDHLFPRFRGGAFTLIFRLLHAINGRLRRFSL